MQYFKLYSTFYIVWPLLGVELDSYSDIFDFVSPPNYSAGKVEQKRGGNAWLNGHASHLFHHIPDNPIDI